ncbi:MAG: hypothetical protein RR744_00275 [Cellulosilyticaceae bacterium]
MVLNKKIEIEKELYIEFYREPKEKEFEVSKTIYSKKVCGGIACGYDECPANGKLFRMYSINEDGKFKRKITEECRIIKKLMLSEIIQHADNMERGVEFEF